MEEREERNSPKKTGDNELRSLLVDFASTTTAHGVGRFATAPAATAKVTWFFIWLCVMAGFSYMLAQLIILYKSKPVSTSVSVEYQKTVAFPGVTVCNLNMLRKSVSGDVINDKLSKQRKKKELSEMYKESLKDGLPQDIASKGLVADEVMFGLDEYLKRINDLPEWDKVKRGYQLDEFLKHCSFAGILCNKGYLKEKYWTQKWHWKYGNCFTFNGYTFSNGTEIPTLNSIQSGSTGILKLAFDIERAEYVSSLTAVAGVRILIADQNLSLYPEESGIDIPPGTFTRISMKKQIISIEDIFNNGSCKTWSKVDGVYSTEHCLKVCKAIKQLQRCNCTGTEYAAISKRKTCLTLADEKCISDVAMNFSRNVLDCSAKCPVPCRHVTYDQTITQSAIFAPGYLKIYGMRNKSLEYVSDNIIQIEVYFDNHLVQTITTNSYYTFENLISDVGGQLGLWIGVSAVTCIEFFALLGNLVMFLVYRNKKTQAVSQNP